MQIGCQRTVVGHTVAPVAGGVDEALRAETLVRQVHARLLIDADLRAPVVSQHGALVDR